MLSLDALFAHLSAVQVFCGLCATVGLVNAWGVSTTASLGDSGTPGLISTHRRSKHTIKKSSCRIDRHPICEFHAVYSRTGGLTYHSVRGSVPFKFVPPPTSPPNSL